MITFLKKPLATPLLALIFFLAGVGSNSAYAGFFDWVPEVFQVSKSSDPAVLPGNPLYFLKSSFREVHLIFTRNAEKRVALRLLYADEKVLEASKLADQGKLKRAARHLENYERDIQKAETQVAELKGKNADVAEKFSENILRSRVKNETIISSIKKKAKKIEEEKEKDEKETAESTKRESIPKDSFEESAPLPKVEINSSLKKVFDEAVMPTKKVAEPAATVPKKVSIPESVTENEVVKNDPPKTEETAKNVPVEEVKPYLGSPPLMY